MLVPAIEMEWYGHENFGSIHGVMMLAADFGVILVRVFSAVFDGLTPVFAILMGVHIAAAFFATTGTLTGQMSKGVMMFPAKNDAGEHLKDDTVDNSPIVKRILNWLPVLPRRRLGWEMLASVCEMHTHLQVVSFFAQFFKDDLLSWRRSP